MYTPFGVEISTCLHNMHASQLKTVQTLKTNTVPNTVFGTGNSVLASSMCLGFVYNK